MNTANEPLVTVLTPVYNGERYLAECIASVLAQTYSNWEYVILDNHSSDRTQEIAQSYAASDRRIRVVTNDATVDVISNHNRAFHLLSADSKYCKVVSADDWLFPECLARMVAVAEANPSVGIVGSYQLSGGGENWADWCVKWGAIPYKSSVVPGKQIGRIYMLGGPDVYGSPTSLLYRSDLVRREERFYPNATAEADTSACCNCLRDADYGFVHQVLSYERVHNVRVTTRSKRLNAYMTSRLGDLLTYGDDFLSEQEKSRRLRSLTAEYYAYLASSTLRLRGREFWEFQRKRLRELGCPLNPVKLAAYIAAALARLLLSPMQLIGKLANSLPSARQAAASAKPARAAPAFNATWRAGETGGGRGVVSVCRRRAS